MDARTQVSALVPMKANSVRVPGKNLRPLSGDPLFCHIIATLTSCRTISTVAVDTDSDEIKDCLRSRFPEVVVIDRLPELAESHVPMNDVIAYDLSRLPGEVFLQTHSTNPLLTSSTIDMAVDAFLGQAEHDALFSVTRLQKRFYDSSGRPVNHDPRRLINTQDLDPLFEENSCIYLFSKDSFSKAGNRLGSDPMMFAIDPIEAMDIDDEADFKLVECIFAARGAR